MTARKIASFITSVKVPLGSPGKKRFGFFCRSGRQRATGVKTPAHRSAAVKRSCHAAKPDRAPHEPDIGLDRRILGGVDAGDDRDPGTFMSATNHGRGPRPVCKHRMREPELYALFRASRREIDLYRSSRCPMPIRHASPHFNRVNGDVLSSAGIECVAETISKQIERKHGNQNRKSGNMPSQGLSRRNS